MQGIGGVFYDYCVPQMTRTRKVILFQQANGNCFTEAYIPIIEKRKIHPGLQIINTGRKFAAAGMLNSISFTTAEPYSLKTNGRTESILMSLPPTVRFDYNYQPQPGSEEARLLDAASIRENGSTNNAYITI